jgi:hypothetical protein
VVIVQKPSPEHPGPPHNRSCPIAAYRAPGVPTTALQPNLKLTNSDLLKNGYSRPKYTDYLY